MRPDREPASPTGGRRAIGLVRLAVPLLVYTVHALFFGSWIVDDAGISFAYARNLAAGHGLVSQPGVPPVEGYSNPLWVLAMVPFFALGLFDPVVTPKLLGLVLVGGAFALLLRALEEAGAQHWVGLFALGLIAINTSFVVWTTSGLENPLYVFLLCLLCRRVQVCDPSGASGRGAAVTGLVAAAVALTRPEGVLYSVLYPLALTVPSVRRRRWPGSRELAAIRTYGLAFGLVFGAYLLFRRLYFGDLLPNTYYAKGGPETGDLPLRLLDLLSGIGSRLGIGLALAVVAVSVWLARRGALMSGHRVLGLFALSSALVHLLLPTDWMGEYRFATPFFAFFYAYAAAILAAALERHPETSERFVAALLVTLLVAQALFFAPRTAGFASRPTVPFDYVSRRFVDKFEEYAARLGIEDASVMLPDVGATLYYSKLEVHDLVGLTDATAARTFGKRQAEFRDYVLEVVRPTFIHLHRPWAARSGLYRDARFRRDYLAIVEYIDESASTPSWTVRGGDYVRRDALGNRAALKALQRENAELRP